MTTFQYQDKLKKLPIPDLEKTCSNYLNVLKPLQTEKEHEKTVEAVQKFLKRGIGRYLDTELRSYAESRNSYIEQFWYDSYLNYDSPVVLNLNPFFLLEDDPFNNEATCVNPQVKRAVSLTVSSLKFIQALKNETFPVDTQRNGEPLCMYQYSKLFGASRIPTAEGCVMQSDPNSNHIIVMSKSQFYWFDVLDDQNNLLMTEQDLIVNFTSIINDSLKTPINEVAKSSFGVLTTENRRIWAQIRASPTITENKNNNEILSIIDSALFVICLDDIVLNDLSELSKNMLCGLSILDKGVQVGTCTNRWYDKLQIIVTQNGKAGINFEHTGVDGHTVLRFVSDIYTDSILSFAQSINSNTPSLWTDHKSKSIAENGDFVTIPRKLEWDLTSNLSLALRFGETRLSDLINQNEFKHLEFKNYGSFTIKKMKYSPDAFVQMAFQASYYALYGKVECTYEPAMTKNFFHGRTEAIRTVSQESNFFVRKFFDPNFPDKEKLKVLSDACMKHTEQTKRCSAGEGVDRHLFALFCIWKRYVAQAEGKESITATRMDETDSRATFTTETESDSSEHTVGGNDHESSNVILGELPEIFADNGWDKLNNTILSTSNCGNPSLRLFGFGPVSANGFGIGYIIKDDSISICASSKHRQTERFLVTLESYLIEIYRIFKEVNSKSDVVAPIDTKIESGGYSSSVPPVVTRAPIPKRREPLNTLFGGYGYFDIGDDEIKSRGETPEPPFLGKLVSQFSVRDIERKLRLSEY
ncbi:acyltransferase ChoActase/COT/CPT [Metschnikowia bicuspidata var. bicuspidata NRRL YB-4993]|uniref:Acyltransferase ChoActase/COT/CPT n=1 Tax=Metschnikowia bicuspidata var. bicuspidata NRRL YB-4993 TaxID=869754 RepID=A0A1A0HGU7_9ASCO|nr:acyltransferase ChoActase/COT/CPT [Metschnikowia bicuspidata var. bicuspidata NRRL YB-4993]OBA23399.1 acyltransferase ChoActase/COT/CPT [Metschnikowia bicuspidata var. bicuspidata NRRL YB-4993]